MSALEQNENATQSAPPWPLTPIPRQNPRLLAPENESVSQKDAEVAEESFDIKPEISGNNVFIEDMWPALAPVKFEPSMELDPRQAPGKDADDSFEKKFGAGSPASA